MTDKDKKQEESEQKQTKEEQEEEEQRLSKAERRLARAKHKAERKKKREKLREKRGTWHPLNILRGIGLFFVLIFKIIFFPFVFVYWKLRDTIKFLFIYNDPPELDIPLITEKEKLSEGEKSAIPLGYIDERKFLLNLPIFYFVSGALGGLIALFITFDFMAPVWEAINDFFVNFSWANTWEVIKDGFRIVFIEGIYKGLILGVGGWFWNGLIAIFDFIFGKNFWLSLGILITVGVLIIIFLIVLAEAEWGEKVKEAIKNFFKKVFNFPKTLGIWIKKGVLAFRDLIAEFAFGVDSFSTYKKRYFYRIVMYSSIITLWIIIATFSVIIYTETTGTIDTPGVVYPVGLVLIGLFNGVGLVSLISFIIRRLTKEKYYINPEDYKPPEELREERRARRQERKAQAEKSKKEEKKKEKKKE